MAMAAPASTGNKLNYSRRRFTDDDLQRLRRELPLRQDSYPYEEVDFSQNELSSAGLRLVLEVCRRCPKLRVLKLYKNQIDDGGAKGLAELCGQCPAIEEMHLSHNRFTAAGVETLITAAEQARPEHISPLWLRLEQNDVGDPEAVFRDLQSRLSVCNRQDEYRCTVRVCCRKMKIHLPFFDMQRATRHQSGRGDRPTGPAGSRLPENAEIAGPSFRVPRAEGSPAVSQTRSTPKANGMPNGGSVWDLAGAARRLSGSSGPAGSPLADGGSHHAEKPPAWGGLAPGVANGPSNGDRLTRTASAPGGPETPAPPEPPLTRASTTTANATVAPTPAPTAPPKMAATTAAAGPPPGGDRPQAQQPPAAKAGPGENSGETSQAPGRPRKPSQEEQQPPPAAATAPAAGGVQGATPAASPPGAGDAGSAGAGAEPPRASVVLDQHGRRRILPKQLEAEDSSNQFVCPLCSFVIIRPVMTTCSHLFCDNCFRNWVSDQVSKMKKALPGDGPVPLIPCPQPRCNTKLRRKDIMPMDKADSKVGAVQLLQRLRNNLAVRCVHHSDHFKHPFGKDAERVCRETGTVCKWVGDLMAYEEHIRKSCPIERYLGGPPAADGAPAAAGPTAAQQPQPPPPKAPTPAEAAAAAQGELPAAAAGATVAVQQAPPPPPKAGAAATPKAGQGQAEARDEGAASVADQGEVRVARYDYNPRDTDKAQIVLKANDFVKIFEVTESGWAAGVRLCKETLQEMGDAGWFPAGYLYPPDHVVAK